MVSPVRPEVLDARIRPGRAHLAALVGLAAEAMCVTDLRGDVVWCNEVAERILGRPLAALAGTDLGRLVHPDDVETWRAVGRRPGIPAPEGGCELRLLGGEGTWTALECTTRVDAARDRIYLVAADPCDRSGAEVALGNSAARLAAIMKHSPSLIFVKDLHGRYLVVNDEFARATGVPVDQAVGRTTEECWPQDAVAIRRRERALVSGGPVTVTDERLHTVDGERDFIVSRFLLIDEAGRPCAIGGISTDVTERRHAERALAVRDQLLDSVIKASPDMITLMDASGKIHQISESDSAMFGYPSEVFTTGELFDFVHPDDRHEVASLFVRLATGVVSHLHLRYRVCHAEGHWVTVDSRARAVLDGDGHFAGAVVVSRDVTDRLAAEERLQASRDAVEQASKAKSEFLSRMSHELRTPLNSVLGFAQLLQMDELSIAQADAVEHVLRAGRHLLDLIDEVLDIARIESGHLELTPVAVSLPQIVGDAVDLTTPMATRAEVVIRTSFDPRRPFVVTADRQRLMQVLLNLLSNAVKYNRPGGRVEVSGALVDGGMVRTAVADTGRGIAAEHIDRVFVPFDRLGVEHSGIEGTGVGLALSHHLCERMGGRLGVESVPEVGSTFFVDLPEADSVTAPAQEEGRDAGAEGDEQFRPPPASSGHGFRVLLVEDSLTTLDLVERVLSRRPGTQVLAAMHGRLGVELAREHHPDLILLDLQLSDMTGESFLDRLADDPATAGIPVAFVGADASPQQVRQLLGRGVIGFLTQPIDVRGLLSLVDAVRAARGN